MKMRWIAVALVLGGSAAVAGLAPAKAKQAAGEQAGPFLEAELIFPLEHWHNHASSIVETPRGDLLVCWFHGSGERTADDVAIQGARLERGSREWSECFLMADTPGYPDTNPALFVDPRQRLWLFWPTILANRWESALMKYKRAPTAGRDGPPPWDTSEVLHVTPGHRFEAVTDRVTDEWRATVSQEARADVEEHISEIRPDAADKLTRRLGWMTRAHPVVLDGTRLIVPLYSDGFSFSLMAISDDWGKTWKTSTPLVGAGNIQPSIARRKDGTLVTYMRDNGPPPKRLMMSTSTDRGETWSPVVDSQFFNPGSGAEVVGLRNGHWVLVYNDLEQGRYSLAVSLSEDGGRTWPWTRHLERRPPKGEGREHWGEYHYPSLIEARDGTLHVSYSYFQPVAESKRDAENRPLRKSIKHAHFNEPWIKQGDQ